MKIAQTDMTTNFNGIRIAKNMPADIVSAIRYNPTIKNAGKHYSLGFSCLQRGNDRHILCLMENPRRDSAYSLMLTPPHVITRKSYWFDYPELAKLSKTPDFFEKMLGKEKKLSFWQRLVAVYENFKMSFLSNKDIKSGKAEEMIEKYTAKYAPVYPK